MFIAVIEILSSERIYYNSQNIAYEEWMICNGKRNNITERDGIRGYGCPIAINHLLIYLQVSLNGKDSDKIISKINNWIVLKNKKISIGFINYKLGISLKLCYN